MIEGERMALDNAETLHRLRSPLSSIYHSLFSKVISKGTIAPRLDFFTGIGDRGALAVLKRSATPSAFRW